MDWNIAQAKQRLSEVIREAAREPQVIYNRNHAVAAVISAEELAEYRSLKANNEVPRTLADEFAELRRIMQEEGHDGLDIPPRTTRPNAFVEVVESEARAREDARDDLSA